MLQPRKWWVGLPLLAILFVLAATLNFDAIEKDVGDRVRATLAGSPRALDNPQVAVAGRDVSVSGVALSKEETAKLLESAEKQAGVRSVADATTPLPVVKPFVFSLERKGGKLTLAGYAPATGERDKIRAAAASKGLEIADRASYGAGAPRNFSALADYGLALLARLQDGKVAFSDAALSISGAAQTSDVYDETLAALNAPPAGAVVRAIDVRPPQVSPFVWSAAKTGDAVVLAGFAPSADTRAYLAAKAGAAGVEVKDETRVASGAPAGDFAGAAAAALAEVAKLTQGKVALAGARLTIEGAGKPNVTAAAIEASARAALPQGFALGPVDVAPGLVSPYVFSARKEGGTLTLSGYAPSAAARDALAAQATRGFDGGVVNDVAVADGAPENFVAAAGASLSALARLDTGSAALTDHDLALEGAAFHAKAPADIQSRLAYGLPKGFTSAARLGVASTGEMIEPSRLRGVLSEIAARGISFDAENSSIRPESLPVVDAFALALLRSPGAAIEIVGHTDNSGSEAENENISRRRAQTVADYLTRAGVDSARLTVTGLGASRPVAANDSDGGRAQNRRIEFRIK